jgi:hypothetical protein
MPSLEELREARNAAKAEYNEARMLSSRGLNIIIKVSKNPKTLISNNVMKVATKSGLELID